MGGLLCLTAAIADPFGDDLVDFPALLLQLRIWKSQQTVCGLNQNFDEVHNFVEDCLGRTSKRHSAREKLKKEDEDDDEDAPDGEDDAEGGANGDDDGEDGDGGELGE